ncbi:hypothetical protein [Bordetella bronchiseptica]|uniref:hypothetical protein n=1 Tax=Bordetella bronchiseptica TaxID=518 RepID=UPI000F6E88FF|nr:hypothetical protein [Bordetella bronchiseptica]QET71414.1 hypothetical protein FOB42_14315 [Bordetella bronchiseptica]VEI25143.1 DnaJ central domain [Bordetella bronchiseptica]
MIGLKPFCGRNDLRPYFNSPWQEDGKVFACDGYIAIQIDAVPDAALPAVDPKMAGRIQKLLSQVESNNVEVAINLPTDPADTCRRCDGSGYKISRACDECEGDGWFEHGTHEYECKECDGEGEHATPATAQTAGAKECDSCDGMGVLLTRYVELHANGTAYKFQERYLTLISRLPSARLIVSGDNFAAARFEFSGGRGVVMPCRF